MKNGFFIIFVGSISNSEDLFSPLPCLRTRPNGRKKRVPDSFTLSFLGQTIIEFLATLFALISEAIKLDKKEQQEYDQLVLTSSPFKEAKMLESIEEYGIEQGIEQGIEIGTNNTQKDIVFNMLKNGIGSVEQIVLCTGWSIEKVKNIKQNMESPNLKSPKC